MTTDLENRNIAILAEDQYEDMELWYPLLRMKEAGASVAVVGMPDLRTFESKHGYPVNVSALASEISPDDFDAVIIPGGYAPDKMRRHQAMLDFVHQMYEQGKIVAMICHAGWVGISAGIVNGKQVTSTTSIRDDLVNAGANWVDAENVQDGNLITSRGPKDLPAFCQKIIAALQEAIPA